MQGMEKYAIYFHGDPHNPNQVERYLLECGLHDEKRVAQQHCDNHNRNYASRKTAKPGYIPYTPRKVRISEIPPNEGENWGSAI